MTVSRPGRRQLLRSGLGLAALGLVVGCSSSLLPGFGRSAQRSIAILDAGTGLPKLEPFRDALRDLGYVEGQNIRISYRTADGKLNQLPALAAELMQTPSEVAVGFGNASVVALSDLTETI